MQRVNLKDIVYASPLAYTRDYCVVVEGVTDVWRLGDIAVATFGINYTSEQVKHLSNNFSNVYILYDFEKQAQAQAESLKCDLQSRGIRATICRVPLGHDPASISQDKVNHFVSEIHQRTAV
jgi:DNA primase